MKLKRVIPFLLFAVMGGSVGFFGASAVIEYFPENDKFFFLYLLIVIPLLYLAMILQIIIHEGGHLVFGLLTGYKFCSYRIFSLCIIKREGRLHLKRYSLAGTGGQCLMDPPDLVDGKIPVFWYNLGGSVLNLIAALLGIIFASVLPFRWLKVFFMIFAIVGFAYALMNGIPMTAGQVDNDGKNALSLGKNPKALRGFWTMMKINALNTEGIEMTDMPREWFFMPEDEDMDNPLVASCGVFLGNRLMFEHNFKEAKEAYQNVLKKSKSLPGIYRILSELDLMYIEIIGENRKEIVEKYWTKEAKSIVKSMKNNPGSIRVKYVYEKSHGNFDQAEKIKSSLQKIEKSYPYPWEIKAEKELMDIYDKSKAAENISGK